MSPERLPILLYHHVGPTRPGTLPSLTVSPARFRAHIRALKRRKRVAVTLPQVERWANGHERLPDRPVLITFDDGYADLVEFAFPVLEQAGMSATVFIVSAQIAGRSAWDDALGGGGHSLLGAEEIRTWHTRGVEFGGHTRTHPDLVQLDEDDLHGEVAGCRRDLDALLGSPPRAFAYPFGSFDERVVKAVAAEFPLAFTAFESRNRAPVDPLLLGRTMVQNFDRPIEIELRTRMGFSPRERAWVALARMRRRLNPAAPAP